MDALMGDALGLGLAATQLGVMHRLFVYRAGPDAPLVAVVNPRLEWRPRTRRSPRRAASACRGVAVDVERPVHVRVDARDEHGEPITIEASGLEARVIQHEMDHLDGVLILDRTTQGPAQGGAARAARAASRARPTRSAPATPPTAASAHRLPRQLGLRGGGAERARRVPAHAGRWSSRRPTARRAAGASWRRRRPPRRRASSGSSCSRPRASTSRARWRRSTAPRPTRSASASSGS